MKKLLLAIAFFAIGLVYIVIRGGTYKAEYKLYFQEADPSLVDVKVVDGSEVVSVSEVRLENNVIKYTVTALSEGKAEVFITISDNTDNVQFYYVNKLGFITEGSKLGQCTGGNIMVFLLILYVVIILISYIRQLWANSKKDYYTYHNVTVLGIIIFLIAVIINNLFFCFHSNGLVDFISGVLNTANAHLIISIPIAFVTALLVLVSNIILIKKEGLRKKNLIGTFFSLLLLVSLVIPVFIERWFQMQTLLDVHKENGIGHLVEIIVTGYCYCLVAYFVVILESTIIIGIRSAHRRPAFDKDYILILGCMMRKDGTPTPLLKGRADAAIKFANMQKKATGKDIIFVPSGGKGGNEPISESECISNYLVSCGIDESRILKEDKSTNTYENFMFLVDKIKEDGRVSDPKIAFATTGYHVFRSGFIASRNGIKAEGVGSKTKKYFWINAFIRELIATMHYEKKQHLIVALVLFVLVAYMGTVVFLSHVI